MIGWLALPRSGAAYTHKDFAGGTGDIALRVMRAAGAGATGVICDISAKMLEAGRERLAGKPEAPRIVLVQGNAEALPSKQYLQHKCNLTEKGTSAWSKFCWGQF
jgi:demethylmenaquinone methyltransferase/2-methoxy-6-polyprenyl-1,4-benzoquinol methylase